MPGPSRRRQFKIPQLKCGQCTRRFTNSAGLSNHFNAAHTRPEGHNVSADADDPDDGLHGENFDLPHDGDEDMPHEEPPLSSREYHPILDGEYHLLGLPEHQILICPRYAVR